jgi:S1-C subfamily serine protease
MNKPKARPIFLTASIVIFILLAVTACGLFGSVNGIISTPLVSTIDSSSSATQEEVDSVHSVPTVSLVTARGSRLAPSNDLEASLIQVYQNTNPSVVYIITPSGSGSGFVYSQDGMIVTNNHVVAGTRSFEVVFANGDRQRASLVGAEADGDLAVIQVEQLPDGVSPLSLAEADSLQVGQFVVAIGNPFGEQGSMTLGIVSALGRSLPSQRGLSTGSTYSLPEVIQTDAPINPGNSGGPLLNLDGQVVGVNAAIASQTGTNSGVGFSIPVSAVRLIVPSLIQDGEYEYPYMGAGFDPEISLEEEAQFGLQQTQGAYVLNVTPGSPADQAGLVAADPNTGRGGDLIIAIDGQPVQNFSDLNSYLVFVSSVGQTIEIAALRDGKQVTLQLTLGSRP